MTQANGGEAAEKQAQKKTEETDELSEEDSELKERIELCVQRTADADASVVANALQLLTQEIKSSTRCVFHSLLPSSSSLSLSLACLGRDSTNALGYERECGHLSVSVHAFCLVQCKAAHSVACQSH